MLDSCMMVEKQSEAFHTFLRHFFPSLKQNFIAYHSSKESSCPDWIFEIHQLWQSGFSRVYSTSCCSCSFEPEIIKIVLSSHKLYSNKILKFQVSTTILNAFTKKCGNLLNGLHIHAKKECLWIYQMNKTVQVKCTLRVNRTRTFLSLSFLMQVSLEKEKRFGEWTKPWPVYQNFSPSPMIPTSEN